MSISVLKDVLAQADYIGKQYTDCLAKYQMSYITRMTVQALLLMMYHYDTLNLMGFGSNTSFLATTSYEHWICISRSGFINPYIASWQFFELKSDDTDKKLNHSKLGLLEIEYNWNFICIADFSYSGNMSLVKHKIQVVDHARR